MRLLNNIDDKKYAWPKRKEYVMEMSRLDRVAYYLGVIKVKHYKQSRGRKPTQVFNGSHFRMIFGLRWYHPLTLLVMIPIILFNFFFTGCSSVVRSCKELNMWEVSLRDRCRIYKLNK